MRARCRPLPTVSSCPPRRSRMPISVTAPASLRAAATPLRGLVRQTLAFERRTAKDIAIVLADDALLRELNRRYRGKDRATDVLSFEYVEMAGARGSDRPKVRSPEGERAGQASRRSRVSLDPRARTGAPLPREPGPRARAARGPRCAPSRGTRPSPRGRAADHARGRATRAACFWTRDRAPRARVGTCPARLMIVANMVVSVARIEAPFEEGNVVAGPLLGLALMMAMTPAAEGWGAAARRVCGSWCR